MITPTNAEYAEQLRGMARGSHSTLEEAEILYRASQRLEAAEISEAMTQRAALAICDYRSSPCYPPACRECAEKARAALTAALEQP